MIRATVHNGRIEIAAPANMTEGMDVTLFVVPNDNDAPMTPEEISQLWASMRQMEPWDMPDEVEADSSEWEKKIERYGIEHRDPGAEDAFR